MSRWSPSYHTACQIQKKILEAMGLEFQQANGSPKPMKDGGPNLSPKDLSSLASSWSNLEDRKRILRNKPLPKAADVKEKPQKMAHASFEE